MHALIRASLRQRPRPRLSDEDRALEKKKAGRMIFYSQSEKSGGLDEATGFGGGSGDWRSVYWLGWVFPSSLCCQFDQLAICSYPVSLSIQ